MFSRIVELPGFNAANYSTYVTPGIVIMMALFGGGWTGMGVIHELENGVMNRFLSRWSAAWRLPRAASCSSAWSPSCRR